MDGDELKATFRRVSAYRHVCNSVRSGAKHTFFNACFMSALTVFMVMNFGSGNLIVLLFGGLALAEFAIAAWKWSAPSVECVLVDSLTSLLFGGSFVIRYFLAQQGIINQRPSIFSLIIGVWELHQAWGHFNAYLGLRRIFVERPTRAQMSYVADMIRDIRESDPQNDPTALELPSQPPIKAQLAEQFAFILDQDSGEAVVVDRDDLTINRDAEKSTGWITLSGQTLAPFQLNDANWRNYLRWKGESE